MKLTRRKLLILNAILLALLAIVFTVLIYVMQLDPVEDLRVKGSQSGTVQLAWDHEGPKSYYLISVRCDGERYGDNAYKTTDTEYRFKALPGGHNYSFYVWTVRNGRRSDCRIANANIKKYIYSPELTGKSDGYRRIDLTWDKVDEAEGYTIEE